MLQNKTIVLTGALGMLGRSAVPMFMRHGANVIGCDIVPLGMRPDIQRLAEEYGESRFDFVQADAADEEQVKQLMDTVDRRFGRLDGAYFNAYTNIAKPLLSQTLEEWEQNLRGTLTSTFLCCKYALPLMIRSGGGSIVNTSSVLSCYPKNNNSGYGAAKAGVNQLSRIIAKEHAKDGIRVNVLAPGDFKAPEVYANLSDKHREVMKREALLGRSGHTDEINHVAAFLLSDQSSYVTGTVYAADGGYQL